jgi:hypothetical protein
MTVSFRVQVVGVQVKEKVVRDKGEIFETLKEGRLTLAFDGDDAPVEAMVALINGERILLGLAASQRTLDEWSAEMTGGTTGIESIVVSSGDRSVTLGKKREQEPVTA